VKRAFLPPHRRDGDPPDPVAIYVALVAKLAAAREVGDAAWEAIVADALDRTWGKLSGDQKVAARGRLRGIHGDRWE
jgi:hypothetical protein